MGGGFIYGVEGMEESRVSSDDRVDARCLANFSGKVHLAHACFLTHCLEVLRVAMQGYGDEQK